MPSPGTLELVLQGGALGLLLVVLVGIFVLAKLFAPPMRDFLVGLVAEQKAITAALGALTTRMELVEVNVKAHVSAVANGVEDEVRGTGTQVAAAAAQAVRQATDPNIQVARISFPSSSSCSNGPSSAR